MNRNPEGRQALGAVLRELRERRGLSQQELGFAADVDRTYVGAVERGEQNISFEGLWQLIYALDVSWEQLGFALDREPALRRRPRTRRDDTARTSTSPPPAKPPRAATPKSRGKRPS